jgi:acyl CoA:acetate/3-ketoacid CoA transferase
MRMIIYSLQNVSKVGNKLTGPGGFIDISQCTKRVNFLGTFTAGGLEISAAHGKLTIVKEGSVKKFVKAVKEVTFSGVEANKIITQKVNYTPLSHYRHRYSHSHSRCLRRRRP